MEVESERTATVLADSLALTDGEYELLEYGRIAAIHRAHAQRGFSTSINGSFGELARGYWWELLFPWLGAVRPLDAKQLARKRYAAIAFDESAIEPNRRVDFREHMQEVIARSSAPFKGKPNTTTGRRLLLPRLAVGWFVTDFMCSLTFPSMLIF